MFNPCYYKLCEKDELFIHNLNFETNSNDTFLFEMVFFDEIYKATEYMVTLVPFICLFSSTQLDRSNILEAENCIQQVITLAAKDIASKKSKEELMSRINQNYFKQLQITDLVMRNIYFYCIYDLSKFENEEEFIILLNTCFDLVCNLCENNLLNSYYIYQWEEIFSKIILREIGQESEICKLHADSIMEIVLKLTNFNNDIMGRVTEKLVEKFEYQNFDTRSLNFLLAIYKAPEKEILRDVKIIDNIMDWITNDSIIYRVFRPIVEEEGKIFLKVLENDKIDFLSLRKNPKIR